MPKLSIPESAAAPTHSEAIAARLAAVRARVAEFAGLYGRDPGSIQVLAVSKTKPPEAVQAAYAAGQRDFGENFLQDASSKLECVPAGANWHFIGALQSNKTRPVAERFAWVHTVDRLRIAQRLSAARPDGAVPLSVCVQVNISSEPSKAGIPPGEALRLAQEVAQLERLRLRGFMAIPRPAQSLAEQRAPFARLREIFESAQAAGLSVDTLSMGMSDDMQAAIAEGATIVRIGTAIFGARDKNTNVA